MEEEYFDFTTWPEGADMVKEMFDFLPDNDVVRTGYLEGLAMFLLTM